MEIVLRHAVAGNKSEHAASRRLSHTGGPPARLLKRSEIAIRRAAPWTASWGLSASGERVLRIAAAGNKSDHAASRRLLQTMGPPARLLKRSKSATQTPAQARPRPPWVLPRPRPPSVLLLP